MPASTRCIARAALGIVCAFATLLRAVPAQATVYPAQMTGTDVVSRWLRSQPARCAFFVKANHYPGFPAILHDEGAIPNIHNHDEWLDSGKGLLPARIGGFYDAKHRIAGFRVIGTDAGFDVIFANAGPPSIAVPKHDLASIVMAGKVSLGDSLRKVDAALDTHVTFPATQQSCAGFQTSIFCSWSAPECRCVQTPFVKAAARLVFHDRRVSAILWDRAPCGYG